MAENLEYCYNYSLSKSGWSVSVTSLGNTSLAMNAEGNRIFCLKSNFEGSIGQSFGEAAILPLALTNGSVQLNVEIMNGLRSVGVASVCIFYEFVPAKGEQINQS